MERFDGGKTDNRILSRLFIKAEGAYIASDGLRAIGSIVNLTFVSLYTGVGGVTAMGYIAPLILIFEMIGSNLNTGSRNKVFESIGKGDLEEADRAFSTSLILGMILAGVMSVAAGVFASKIAFLLGIRDPEIHRMTVQYIRGYVIGVPFFALTKILNAYLYIEGKYKMIGITATMATVSRIAATAVVVFGIHGGMFAIGLAVSIGYIIPFFPVAAFFFSGKSCSVFHFRLRYFGFGLSREILVLGASMCIAKGSTAAGGILINNLLTSMNVPYLVASYGIFSQLSGAVRFAWNAPADALFSFAKVFIGEEDRGSLKELQKIALAHAFYATFALTFIFLIFARQILGIYLRTDDAQAVKLGIECIRVASLSFPFHAIVYNFRNYLMSVKRMKFCNIYAFLVECGVIVPVTFLMTRMLGGSGAWGGKVVSMILLSLFAVLYILKTGEGVSFSDKMLLLPESFGVDAADEIAVIIRSTKELFLLSKVAVVFAVEHGADEERSMTYGLLVEEMSDILTQRGFSEGKANTVNVRLVAKDEDLIFRLRDDCELFNPLDYYKAIKDIREKIDHLALAVIMENARDVRYTAAFGANNLIVRI